MRQVGVGPGAPLPSQAAPGKEHQTGKGTHHPLTYGEPGNVPGILGQRRELRPVGGGAGARGPDGES